MESTETETETLQGRGQGRGLRPVPVPRPVPVDIQKKEKKSFSDRAGEGAAGSAWEPPKGGPCSPPPPAEGGRGLYTLEQLFTITERNHVEITAEGLRAFYDQMNATGWSLYGRPVERKTIVRVLREWANKHQEQAAERPVKYEKLEPFTQWQLAKYLENYSGEGDDEDDILDSAWEGVYSILERLFPEEEREKLDSAAIDWSDEKTIREAIKGGYCSRHDFAKDMRQFILTETGVRFPL